MKKIQYNGISKLLSGITTKINSLIDIVELKADWEQTDPTAFDYIKNKPDSLDEKVKQENTTSDEDYRVLLSKSANDITEIDKTWKNSDLKYNPFTGNLTAVRLNGNEIGNDPQFTDTTYENKAAVQGGSAESLVTTGEKYNWNTAHAHSHLTSGNPHNVTKSDVGLWNVPNVSTDNQTPTVTEATQRDNIANGDNLKTIIGKIKKFFTDLKTVAFTGSYNDLLDKPSIPSGQIQSDWEQTDSAEVDYIKHKPSIPTVNDATLTIQKNGTNVQTFTANASSNKTANIIVPNGSYYGTCSSNADVSNKVVTISSDQNFTLAVGSVITVKFSNSNTASDVTLNINSTGAKPIYYNNAVYTLTSTTVCGTANRVITYIYDGTNWVWVSHGADNNTTYSTMAADEVYNGTVTTAKLARADRLNADINKLIDDKIDELPEPMIFKGSLGTGGTITTLPTASSSNKGYTYKVITNGTYASQSAKVGDTFISDGSTWVLIPSGDEPSGTVTSVKIEATSPIAVDNTSAITNSGTRTISHETSGATAGSYGDSGNQTPAYGGTFKVPYITVNDTGHVTGISAHTVKIPASDNTNTTYTFANGTNKFTATPSSGSATDVSVTPQIKIDGITSDNTEINCYGECSTDAGTAAKTVSITKGTFALGAGSKVIVKFTNANTANNPTLNVNSKGAKNIFHNGARITTGTNKAMLAGVIELVYDGTQFHLVGNYVDTNTTYTAGTGLSFDGTTINHSNSVTAGTAKGDNSKTLTFGGTFTVPSVTYDAQGHVTAKGTTTMTMPANPNTDTTYTFTGGTNKFTVTPSGGTATDVTITPSISNNITGSGTRTNGYLAKFSGTNTITNGPQIGSDTTKFLRNDGSWEVPSGTYELPLATSSVRGGVKIGYTQSGKNYPVQLDSEKMYVNVPWTDTNTKVTAVGNHYAPAEDATAQIDVDASGGSAATWNTTNMVTGVTVKRDAKGHVTGLAVDSIKIPQNPVLALDVAETSVTAEKTIATWKETDGKVAITTQDISITSSQVSDLSTNGTAKASNTTQVNFIASDATTWHRIVMLANTGTTAGKYALTRHGGLTYTIHDSGDTNRAVLSFNTADGVADTERVDELRLGNSTQKTSANHAKGALRIYSEHTGYVRLVADYTNSSKDVRFIHTNGQERTVQYGNRTKVTVSNTNTTLICDSRYYTDLDIIIPLSAGQVELHMSFPIPAITKTDSTTSATGTPTNYHSVRQGYYYASTALGFGEVRLWKNGNNVYCKLINVFQNNTTNIASNITWSVYYR